MRSIGERRKHDRSLFGVEFLQGVVPCHVGPCVMSNPEVRRCALDDEVLSAKMNEGLAKY